MRLIDAIESGEASSPPPYLNVRFDIDARPVRESGCTVIHHISEPAVNRALSAARDRIRAASTGAHFAWLPPSSYHMTLFDLMLHSRRGEGYWPAGLSPDATDAEVDAFALGALKDFDLGDAHPFQIAPRLIYAGQGGIGVAVTGASDADEARLRRMRDRIAEATGLGHRAGHDEYAFHITIAYLIGWPNAEETTALDEAIGAAEAALIAAHPVITLNAPEACRFHDMTAFAREFDLS
ncbi:MAG: DUF1868 domain-containing protein [Pseudomonadota bacterium]